MKNAYACHAFLVSICLAALLTPPALAADPAPTPPWVAPVPANAEWTITLSSPAAGAKPPPSATLQTIHVIKTGTTKHDTITYSNGTTEEAWYVGKNAFLTDTFSKANIYLTEFSAYDFGGLGDPVHSLGFTGFDWVKAGNYDTIVSYQNERCYHYRFQGQQQAEAWIQVKDKLPVAYQISGILYVYSFAAPPSTPLALPPAYQAIWDQSLLIQKRQALFQQDLGKH
jgi:hypothetical protein